MRTNLFDKIIVLGLLFFSSFAAAQITVNTNFDPRTNQPIDIRDTLTFLADTSAVTWTYPGLVAYAADADQFWYYTGSFWKRVVQDPFFSNLQDVDTAGIDVEDIAQWDGSNWVMTSPGDVVSAGSDSTNSIYNLLPTQDVLINPNANDLIIGSFGAGNSGDFEFFTTNEDGQYAGIFAGTRDSSWLATAGDGFQFDVALFSTGAEDGVMGVGYNYFGTVWNAAVFGDSVLFAPYPGSELNMTINGLPDDPVNPYKVMVQDTVTDRVYLTSIDSLLGSGTAGTLPIWTGANALGNSSLTEASGVLSSSLTGALKLPAGTDAQDPVWSAGMLRYNTTANGLQGYDGTAERYLPWSDADNWAANRIPYSNGSALTSESDFAYNGSELSINMTDQGAYNLQARGPVLFSNDGTNATGFIFTPSDRKITSALPNLGVVIEGNGGNSVTTIYGKSSIYLRVDVNSDNDIINFQNGSGSDYASFSGRLHYYKFGQANSTTAFTIKAFNNGNMAGKPLIIGGGESVSSSASFDGGKLFLRGGSGSAGLSPTSLPGNVEIGRYAVGGTLSYTALSEWKLDTIYHYKYGTGAITGTHAYSASFNSSGKLIEVPEKWASISTSTDGSGDIVVAHGMGITPTVVTIQVEGTTYYGTTVHSKNATNFTVRFFDMSTTPPTPLASTAVTATWHAKT